MTKTQQPARPIVPAFYSALMSDYRRTLRALDWDNMADAIMTTRNASWTPEQRAEVDAYNREVDIYNSWLNEQRRTHNAEVAKRNAARATAKLRAATCPDCFTVHAGECY